MNKGKEERVEQKKQNKEFPIVILNNSFTDYVLKQKTHSVTLFEDE
jgi:hypothetical protein